MNHCCVFLVSVTFVSIIHSTNDKILGLKIFHHPALKAEHCAVCLNLRQLFMFYLYSAE